MLDFAIRIVINAVALVVAVLFVPQIHFNYSGDQWWRLLIVALIFGIINTYIRPIVKALSLPLMFVFIGLVGLIINTAMLLLLAVVSHEVDKNLDQVHLGFKIAGWPNGPFTIEVLIYAIVAGIIIAIVSTALSLVRKISPV